MLLPTSTAFAKFRARRGLCSIGSMSAIVIPIVVALAVVLAIGLAYVPLRLLLGHMARNVREFIERQRERRSVDRATGDRRKV